MEIYCLPSIYITLLIRSEHQPPFILHHRAYFSFFLRDAAKTWDANLLANFQQFLRQEFASTFLIMQIFHAPAL